MGFAGPVSFAPISLEVFTKIFARGSCFGQRYKVMSCFLTSPPSLTLDRLGLYFSISTIQPLRLRHLQVEPREAYSRRDPWLPFVQSRVRLLAADIILLRTIRSHSSRYQVSRIFVPFSNNT